MRRKKIRLPSISPGKVLVRSALVCGLLGAISFGLALRRIEPLPLSDTAPQFNSKNAFNVMRDLSKKFPNRVPWGENRRKAAVWLKSEFSKMGYTPKGLRFSEVIAGKQYTDLENVYVEKRGTTHPDEIVVAMAHYDIVDTTVEGAMDDGTGVGVVMELARVFSKEPSDRTLVFLLTDSEEYGAFWGATAFAKSYEKAHQIVAATNFDFISPEKQTGILTLCDGLKSGYTPLWLRELALNSLRSLGTVEVKDMYGLEEFVERAVQIPPSDHGAFLAAGIPAFNWVGQTDDFAYIMTHYHHTPFDVVEPIRQESFDSFGQGAERIIRSINSLDKLPDDYKDSSYWKISPQYYLCGWGAILLHILAFIPFIAFSLSKFGAVFRTKGPVLDVVRNEAKVIGILFGSFLLGYVAILLLPALRVVTQYEIFPATQKSLILYNPDFLAIFLVVALIIGVHWIFRRTFSEPNDSMGYPEIRQGVHAAFLTLVIFLAFLKNSYLGVLLLLPPAYFWTALSDRRQLENRILNGLLIVSGAITFLAIAIIMTTIFHVGVVYWYLFLSAAYGLISAYSVVLFFMALTVMIRLFRAFVL